MTEDKNLIGDGRQQLNKIYLGDCLDLVKKLDDHSVDLVLTDPPYNISRKNNFHSMGRAGVDFGEWDKGFDLFSYIGELPRVLKKDASVIIFNDWKNLGDIARCCESNGMLVKGKLRWKKANPMPRNIDRLYVNDFEDAVWCVNGEAKWTFNRQGVSYERPCFESPLTPKKEKTGHPTQKPLALMENLLNIHSNKGDVVLDLFAGSGTTAIACIESGRNFICFEKDEEYFKTAKERIDAVISKNMSRRLEMNTNSVQGESSFRHMLFSFLQEEAS